MRAKAPRQRGRRFRIWDDLPDLEKAIRVATHVGMFEGVVLTIEFISGFELFGSYETWAQGWRVSGSDIKVEKEHLDDAISAWITAKALREANDQTNPKI